jgi:type III pantothenate kinase
MKPDVIVDIGNTRLKWALVGPNGASFRTIASLADDPAVWQRQMDEWPGTFSDLKGRGPLQWVAASVNPGRTERLSAWVEARGDQFFHLRFAAQLPLRVGVEHPDWVGIDRLLDAVAALEVLPPGRGAVLIDAGSAVTIDWLDEEHVFRGGCIYPGLDLMAEALHGYTALLPRVTVERPVPPLPAGATIPAMQVGIFLAVSGGIRETVRRYAEQARVPPQVFFSGGQAPLLAGEMGLLDGGTKPPPGWEDWRLWPEQTLMGILQAARALP